MLLAEYGLVFSFLKSEKLGTDCTRGFSDCILLLAKLELDALEADLEAATDKFRGVDDEKFLFGGKSLLFWALLEAPFPKDASLIELS